MRFVFGHIRFGAAYNNHHKIEKGLCFTNISVGIYVSIFFSRGCCILRKLLKLSLPFFRVWRVPHAKTPKCNLFTKKTYAIVRLNLRHIHFIVTLIRIFSKQKNKKRIRVFICQWAYDQDHSKTSSSSQLEKVPKKWSENRKSIASRGNGLIFMAHPANQDLFLMK